MSGKLFLWHQLPLLQKAPAQILSIRPADTYFQEAPVLVFIETEEVFHSASATRREANM